MMGRISILLGMSLVASLSGCGAFDSGSTWQSGPYRITWIDERSNSVLGYEMGGGSSIRIAGPCVFAVGENQKFVSYATVTSSATTHVHVLSKSKYDPSKEPDLAIHGPYSFQKFQQLAKEQDFPAMHELFAPTHCGSRA